MKRLFTIFISLAVAATGFAQEKDKCLFSVHYMAHFKEYAEANSETTDERILDVGKQSSCFYARWQQRREELTDSVVSAGGTTAALLGCLMDIPMSRQKYAIYNNYPVQGRRLVTDVLIKNYHYEEAVEPLVWDLADCDTTILGYHSQKAVCQYRGRKWTAFYTLEIAVPAGPWKLHGLPGLILYATDDSGIFSFECIEIRKNSRDYIYTPNLSKSIKCTREALNTLHRDSWRNPEDFAKRFGSTGKGVDANGKPIIYKEKTALFLD